MRRFSIWKGNKKMTTKKTEPTMTDNIWEYYAKEYQRVQFSYTYNSCVCSTCPTYIETQKLADRWRQIAERFANIDIHDQAALAFAYASFEEMERAVQP